MSETKIHTHSNLFMTRQTQTNSGYDKETHESIWNQESVYTILGFIKFKLIKRVTMYHDTKSLETRIIKVWRI